MFNEELKSAVDAINTVELMSKSNVDERVVHAKKNNDTSNS